MERSIRGALEQLKRDGAPYQGNWFQVPRYKVDSVDSPFVRDLVRKAEPFVLEGAASHWDEDINRTDICSMMGSKECSPRSLRAPLRGPGFMSAA